MDKVIREGAVRVGVDLAKRVIQVHAVDAHGRVLKRRALARDKFIECCVMLPAGCVVAMEASSSAHHWARKLVTLGLDARIISAQLVSPYRGAAAEHDPTTNFPARREIEDVLNRSDRRWASSTNPWWRSMGSDHETGM